MTDAETGDRQFRTEYYDAAKRHIKKLESTGPTEAGLAIAAVDNLHQQAAERMTRWESSTYPGVSEIHTSVSALEILQNCGQGDVAKRAREFDSAKVPAEQWFVFSATPNALFPTDGGPLTAFDIAMDRALRAMPTVRRSVDAGTPRDLQITMMGSPLSLGGLVSGEWVDALDRESFYVAQARLHAEYLTQRFQNSNETIYLTGKSMGALMAMITAKFLPEEMQARVKIVADNPDPTYGGEKDSSKDYRQMLTGLVKEVGDLWERREDVWAKAWITSEQKKMMQHAGVWKSEDSGQKRLKKRGLDKTWKDLEAGPKAFMDSFYPDHAQVYIRQGVHDETRVGKTELETFLSDEETRRDTWAPWLRPEGRQNVRQWGFKGGHGMRRHNYDSRWIKAAAHALGD